MKALLYTSDPYEPSGVIGLFENETQKNSILLGYQKHLVREHIRNLSTVKFPSYYAGTFYHTKKEAFYRTIESTLKQEINALKEIDIPVGIYGEYF